MTPELTITLIVILVFISLALFISIPINLILKKRYFRYTYYYKIRKLVDICDFRLINNFYFQIDESTQAHFDHVIFGQKYIYLITSKFYRQGLLGKPNDESWLYFKNKKNRVYIENPLQKNELRTEKLALVSGIGRELFIPIVIVNNDCIVNERVNLNKNNFIVKIKNIKKFINHFEKSDVSEINDAQLQNVVYMFDKIKK